MALLIAGSSASTCGRGYLGGSEAFAFTVTYRSCATGNYTFAHEVGHNFGADHDLTAAFPPTTPVPYGHGYVDSAGLFYTVMAYGSSCGNGSNCTRLLNFSNPAVLEGGRATGNDAAQNARVLNESAATLASYRQSQIYASGVTTLGRARFKSRLEAVPGSWAPANVRRSYQWYVDGRPVKKATGKVFELERKRIGQIVSLLVTGTAPTYAPASVSTPPVKIKKAAFKKSARSKVLGKHKVRARLAVAEKSLAKWKPDPKKFKFRWFRNENLIKGAKSRVYRVTRKDRDKLIVVTVTGKKRSYASTGRTSKKLEIRRR